ncbi:Polyphosphate kinase (ppk1) [Nostocoides japonicum T1-X7]|uniref:Polyphosphate kinase n=1 Tax=Nostocoides japonicum T1-X7 TaxID=1194083 RepID=A0A077LZ27_9MICO|nr:RNA degradosome polyphosphate kinase [Tetrasphaera japonica]CCH77204.1 Polyphosphate kinase (ppk1) [Tetrasphaera japonica T1-X7]
MTTTAPAKAGSEPVTAPQDEELTVAEVATDTTALIDERRHPLRAANGRFVRAGEAATPDADELPLDRFLDREISWLQFNERVLQLAADENVPLLERARFLAIFTSNLDEFFMVRVAGLKRRITTGIAVRAASGLEPREQLDQIAAVSHELLDLQAKVFHQLVRPALSEEGISIVRWDELSDTEHERLGNLFTDQIFPVLTPLAVDPAHPFPYISGLSLNLAVVLINPRTDKEHFARVKVPPLLPRLVVRVEPAGDPLSDAHEARFVPLEDVIAAHLDQLFPGMEVHQHFTFRVTRNEDLEVEEDDAENLLTALERELTRRRFGPPVRLEVEESVDDHVMDLLVRELGVHDSELYRLPAPLDLRALNVIADLERSELHYPPFLSRSNPDLAPIERSKTGDILASIRRQDVLLQHPYDSFSTSVQAFIEQAATDPKVLAIKQTLYRTSGDSPIVDALIDAAEAGKQVLAVVEIKARFDEQNNISWARKLEAAGVHVVYGIVGLKTHCKLCLVVRQEGDGLIRYCHIGTGNYNPKTARLYEDFGLLTVDPQVGEDLTRLFNQLSGQAPKSKFKRLLVAPRTVRTGLIERIDAETARARHGEDAWVAMKLNAIVDEEVVDALYRASRAGVKVQIWARGTCAIRPGVPGLSENIAVHSILGRFLEHSRVFLFGNGGETEAWIGSADMMHRNLDRRVEALVRVTDPRHVDDLTALLRRGMSEDYQHWWLGSDGRWNRSHLDEAGEPLADVQGSLIEMHSKRIRKARRR